MSDLVIGEGRGGRRRALAEVEIEVVRSLVEADMELLANPPPMGTSFRPPQRIRQSHHQLAQLMASGRSDTESSALSGYSPAYISGLRRDPTFRELISVYESEREIRFAEVAERMRTLGLSALDEIQAKLEEEPEAWTKRELMELADLLLVKSRPGGASASAGGAVSGVQVNVQFVTPSAPPGPTIKGDLVDGN